MPVRKHRVLITPLLGRGRQSRTIDAVLMGVALALALAPSAVARSGTGVSDVRLTRDATAGSYMRYDGQTDLVMTACSTSRRKQSEPTVAVDPRDTDVIVAGA